MTNEAGRALTLLITLVNKLFPVPWDQEPDPALAPIRAELAAFAGLFAHQSRSAANYHLGPRGKAILELGPQEALEGGPQGLDLVAAYNELRDRMAEMEGAVDAGNPA